MTVQAILSGRALIDRLLVAVGRIGRPQQFQDDPSVWRAQRDRELDEKTLATFDTDPDLAWMNTSDSGRYWNPVILKALSVLSKFNMVPREFKRICSITPFVEECNQQLPQWTALQHNHLALFLHLQLDTFPFELVS